MSASAGPPSEVHLEKGLTESDKSRSTHEHERGHPRNDSINTVSRPSSPIEVSSVYNQPNNKSTRSRLARKITIRSNADVIDPGPPPDGGLKAWTQALMGHLVVFNTWGMISAFSVFQAYYTSELGLEPSAVSWIGSVQMMGHFALGIFTGRAFDAGLFYWLVIPGLILGSLSMFMTSLCDQYWQLFLAQGLLFGLGCGLQFTPSASLVYTYFSSNKVVALAIVASGSATGGLIYPTIARQLIPKIGFAWTTRITGFIMLAVGCCYCSLLRPRLPPRRSGPLLELSAFKEAPYTLYLIGVFLTCLGQYFGFYYIGSYSLQVVGVPYDVSVDLIMIMNGVGVVGRILPGYLADQYFGGYNTLIPFVFASAAVMYSWTAVRTTASLYVFAAIYGVASAGFQGLFPSVLSSLTKDLSRVGVRNGMGFCIVGFAVLTGPPIAGALVQRGGYLTAQMWSGSMIVAGGGVLVLGRVAKTGLVLRAKV
ncbi:MFS general substrate transporter [Westerdykella ornata]|uniref:MFS general substrate transporter n=1 Tax=Westerdykella ornata TaxID=318751 RepID=A0A6A6JJA6_WESOR|nr:MFS general substrate transporter [Westerdykella ornata]KAF2276567.1 MFS general substrate transporter [Westerdykella ornata]